MWLNGWKAMLWLERELIDVLDPLMMCLLGWRMSICKGIGRIKIKHKLPIHVPEREKEILKKMQSLSRKFNLSDKAVRILAKAVMWESKRVQKGLAEA